jgi:hypothetical protein
VNRVKRALLSLCLLSATVTGLNVVGAAPASAGLSPSRICANFNLFGNGWDSDHFLGSLTYGNDKSSTTCRVNGPSSPTIACSVPNTIRVAFYSTAFNGAALRFENCVSRVSWRDDLGQAHFVDAGNFPNTMPLCFFDPPL